VLRFWSLKHNSTVVIMKLAQKHEKEAKESPKEAKEER
jgi:hypothetical protein